MLDMAMRKSRVEEKRSKAPTGEVEVYGQHAGAGVGGGVFKQRSQ